MVKIFNLIYFVSFYMYILIFNDLNFQDKIYLDYFFLDEIKKIIKYLWISFISFLMHFLKFY